MTSVFLILKKSGSHFRLYQNDNTMCKVLKRGNLKGEIQLSEAEVTRGPSKFNLKKPGSVSPNIRPELIVQKLETGASPQTFLLKPELVLPSFKPEIVPSTI